MKLLEIDGYQRPLATMVYNFFDKKTRSGVSVNEKLAKELHKPVTKKSNRQCTKNEVFH